MSSFKKMLLMSQEELERIKAKQIKEYDPSITALARVQNQVDSVLTDPTIAQLPADQRLKLLQKLQHRFEQIKHEGDTPLKLAGVSASLPEPASMPATPTTASTTGLSRPAVQLFGINQRYRNRADTLMKHILQDPASLSVNERNEIVVKGRTVPGSNIIDLVSDAFATSKSRVDGPRPQGFSDFVTALRDVNAPRTLLMNPSYSDPISATHRRSVHHPKLSSTSHNLPHKRPRILSLYKI